MAGSVDKDDVRFSQGDNASFKRASSLITMEPQSEEEMNAIRSAAVNMDGFLVSVFDILRRVPRRVLMVMKLNDLTRFDLIFFYLTVSENDSCFRNLDHALATTHSNVRKIST